MTIKQTLENHIVIFVLSVAVVAFGSGWSACELARVAYKNEKITDLEKKNADQALQIKEATVAIEPYQRQISELLANTKRLESDLSNSQGNLSAWQQSLQSWKTANVDMQNNLELYASNCSVIGMVRAIEGKKDSLERTLAAAYGWDSEKPKIDDYKRRVAEYQARLASLQEKLACVRR